MPRMRARRVLLAALYSQANQPSTIVDELSAVDASTKGQTTVAAQSTGVQMLHSSLTDSGLAMHQHRLVSNSAMMHVFAVAGRGAPAG